MEEHRLRADHTLGVLGLGEEERRQAAGTLPEAGSDQEELRRAAVDTGCTFYSFLNLISTKFLCNELIS